MQKFQGKAKIDQTLMSSFEDSLMVAASFSAAVFVLSLYVYRKRTRRPMSEALDKAHED